MAQLLTFGALELQGVPFVREKPLLLLAYLALNAPQARRDVARRFWPGASDPMNSLSVALGQLRRAAPELVRATEATVAAGDLGCDATDLRQAALNRDPAATTHLYRGAFLSTLTLADLGEELEDWVMHTREDLAGLYRGTLLAAARATLPGDPTRSGEWAALAARTPGAAPPTEAEYRDLHALLGAAGHPDATRLAREAEAYGLTLTTAPAPAPAAPLLGRTAELARITALRPGETLWVRGAAGLGKTALLRAATAAGGTLLSGRSGQPWQTLRPLDAHAATETAWQAALAAHTAPLLVDDWDAADPESRRALLTAARARAGGPLVLASRERPPAPLPELPLRPITEGLNTEELDATGGLPALLGARCAGTPLADAYAPLLAPHPPRTRQLLACLGVQPSPDLKATQAALELGGDDMALALEALGRACLLDGAQPTAPAALRAWLDTQPSLETEVLTLLAPQLPRDLALPHYLRAHELTGASDFPGFQAALATRARALLAEDRHVQAHELLHPHAQAPETRLLLARALDAMGQYPEALKVLDTLSPTPLMQAFRGRSLFRLGRLDEAGQAAQQALGGDLEARAQAHNLLGALSLTARNHAKAQADYERAAGLFMLCGDEANRLHALCSQAVATQELGEDAGPLITALEASAAEQLPVNVLLNLGWLLDQQGQLERALDMARRAATRAEHTGQDGTAARAWNNVGVLHHKLGRPTEAAQAYQRTITLARQAGELRLMALALGNLAELQDSLPLIEEALSILSSAGQDDLVAYFEAQREAFRGRSGPS